MLGSARLEPRPGVPYARNSVRVNFLVIDFAAASHARVAALELLRGPRALRYGGTEDSRPREGEEIRAELPNVDGLGQHADWARR